jgi:hypothetical protein
MGIEFIAPFKFYKLFLKLEGTDISLSDAVLNVCRRNI